MPPPIPEAEVPEPPVAGRQTQAARRIPVAILPDQQIPVAHPVRQALPVHLGRCASDASASARPEAAEYGFPVHPEPADEAAQRSGGCAAELPERSPGQNTLAAARSAA